MSRMPAPAEISSTLRVERPSGWGGRLAKCSLLSLVAVAGVAGAFWRAMAPDSGKTRYQTKPASQGNPTVLVEGARIENPPRGYCTEDTLRPKNRYFL